MAYIGKAPNTAIVNQTTSQSFNGTGSATAFTLNRSVNVGEDLEVFVNNVQQEPGSGKSYTASGTTLTFDEAPPSGTGNIYVIYRGEATINPRLEHDANAALAATTGTFSDAVTVANGLTVDDDGATVLTVDRATSDGDIIELQKDGSKVGSIGTSGSQSYIHGAGTDTGLYWGSNNIYPYRSTGLNDNTIDLGYSSKRFKDLYLGGNLYLGGTGSSNALNDYEEGTFTPQLLGGTSNPSSTVSGSGEYVKVGKLVFIYIKFHNVNTTGASGYIRITGQPFTPSQTNGPLSMSAYDFDFSGRTSLTAEINNTEINGITSGDDAGWGLLNFGAGAARYIFIAGTYRTA